MAGAILPLTADSFSGQTMGKYEILCRLSTGGMSEIFLAFQRGLAGFRKLVVLKSILPNIRGEEEFVRMFLDEAKITAAFSHPNIAQVYDLDTDDDQLFLAMEFVPGCTLVELARACRAANESIPTGFTLLAVKETALALHYAHTFTDPLGHRQTVIHRDVAEKNIMVTYEGTTKLLDFGIAKSLNRAGRTTVGMVKGTSGYMSPEQILGEPLDARSDLFSLGVVLHECLTGMRLFHGKDAEAGMIAALKEDVAPPSRLNGDVSPELDAVVLKTLARKRDERYTTCLEFARALERVGGQLLWHAEQSGELVQRLFRDRREQARQLLESAQLATSELTSELRLAGLLGDPVSAPKATPQKSTPSLATPRKPLDSVRRPAASPERAGGSKATAVNPGFEAPTHAGSRGARPTPSSGQPILTVSDGDVELLEDPSEEKTTVLTPGTLRDSAAAVTGPAPPVDERVVLTIPATSLPSGLFPSTSPQRSTGPESPVPPPRESSPSLADVMQKPTSPNLSEAVQRPTSPDAFASARHPVTKVEDGLVRSEPLGPEPGTRPEGHALPVPPLVRPRRPAREGRAFRIAVGAIIAMIVVGGLGFLVGVHRYFVSAGPAALERTEGEEGNPTPPVEPPDSTGPVASGVVEATGLLPTPPTPTGPVASGIVAATGLPPTPPTPTGPVATGIVAATGPSGATGGMRPVPPRLVVERTTSVAPPRVLPRRAITGQLTLMTEPWAKVFFKAQELGVTPLFQVSLPAGRQTLRLIGADHRVLLLHVDVKEGAVTPVRVSLSTLTPE